MLGKTFFLKINLKYYFFPTKPKEDILIAQYILYAPTVTLTYLHKQLCSTVCSIVLTPVSKNAVYLITLTYLHTQLCSTVCSIVLTFVSHNSALYLITLTYLHTQLCSTICSIVLKPASPGSVIISHNSDSHPSKYIKISQD